VLASTSAVTTNSCALFLRSHRSLPFWQDVRIGQGSLGGKPHAPEHMRSSLDGLSVEYAKRAVGFTGVHALHQPQHCASTFMQHLNTDSNNCSRWAAQRIEPMCRT
jgi:hypothetical protein